jgi:putative membrane protein insertion efficiency factor
MAPHGAPALPARAVIALLRWYRRFLSPLLPQVCRFEPSCSMYAREAIELHGLARGARLAAWRLLRCQPWSRGGFDPVPAPKNGTSR